MKIKEIRLLNITVLQNNIEIYNGPVRRCWRGIIKYRNKKHTF